MARKCLSGRKLGEFAEHWSSSASSAHLWYFGFRRKQGFRCRLCTGTAIPWAGALPYRYITSGVIGPERESGERWGE